MATHIKTLEARNFKGLDLSLQLDPVTVITGDNYQGKTAVLEVIRLGLTGYLPPPIGKLAKNIFSLAGQKEGLDGVMELALVLSNARNIRMRWTRNTKGAVSVDGAIPADLAMPELLMDSQSFFALTKDQQTALVFNTLSQSPITRDQIAAAFHPVEAQPFKACESMKETILKRLDSLLESMDIQEAATKLVEAIKQEGKEAKAALDRASGSFNALRLDPGPRPTDRTEALKEARAKLAAASSDAKNQLLYVTGARTTEDAVRILNNAKLEIKSLNEQLDKVPQPVEIEPILAEIEDIRSKHGAMESKRIAIASKLSDQEGTLALLTTEDEPLDCCPTCRNKAKGWRTKAIASFEGSIAELKAELALIEPNVKHLYTELTKASARHEKAHLGNIASERSQQQIRANIEKLTKMVATGKALLPKLNQIPDTSALEATIADLEVAQANYLAYEKNKAQRAQFETEVLENQARVDTCKGCLEALNGLIKEANDKLFNSILSTANLFTDGLLNSPIEFQNGDLGRRVSDKDLQHGIKAAKGAWISHTTFSGTEKLITYAAFGVALANKAPFKVVLMDELGRLDLDNKVKLIQRMNELVGKGVIDQFVGVDVNALDYDELCTIVEP